MKYSTEEGFKDLTQSQLMIWTGQELNPGVPPYKWIMGFDFLGPIDYRRFQEAFRLLAQQSDAMRTIVKLVDGVPKQLVQDQAKAGLEFWDISQESNQDQKLSDWLAQQNQHIFDLTQCAFQSALIKINDTHFVWYLNQHHIITDAWGVTTQYQAISKLYRDLASIGKGTEQLPQYDAFVRSQQDTPAEYWENKLKDTPPALRLYGHTQQVLTTASKRISVELGLQRSKQIRSLASKEEFKTWTVDLSLYNIFVTLLTAYLERVTGQRKLSIGTPAHNRSSHKFKQTPGLFIQFFPLFLETKPGTSFVELHQQVRNETSEFMLNAVPGAAAASTNRSFQVILNYIHATFDDFNGIPMSSQWIHPGHSDPNHHLRLQVHDFDGTGNIKLDFDLNEQIFPEDIQKLVPGHFIKLLDAFLEDQDQPIDKPALLSDSEYQRLVKSDVHENQDNPKSLTVLVLFVSQVQKDHQETALICEDISVSYQDLEERSNKLAHYLMQQGIGTGSRVVLLMNRSIELIEAIWGVLKSGACYVPVDPSSPTDRVDYVIRDLEADGIITCDLNQSLDPKFRQIDLKVSDKAIASHSSKPPQVKVQGDHQTGVGISCIAVKLPVVCPYELFGTGKINLPIVYHTCF